MCEFAMMISMMMLRGFPASFRSTSDARIRSRAWTAPTRRRAPAARSGTPAHARALLLLEMTRTLESKRESGFFLRDNIYRVLWFCQAMVLRATALGASEVSLWLVPTLAVPLACMVAASHAKRADDPAHAPPAKGKPSARGTELHESVHRPSAREQRALV